MSELSEAQRVVVDTLKAGGRVKSGPHGAWRTQDGFTFSVRASTLRALVRRGALVRTEGPMSVCAYALVEQEGAG